MRRRPKLECPRHGVPLVGTNTRYEKRYSCPRDGCTVACWGSSTSTPADEGTRDARRCAHATFDPLWQSGHMSRSEAYRVLAEYMGLPVKDCHIGMFTRRQCHEVQVFVHHWRSAQLPSHYLDSRKET